MDIVIKALLAVCIWFLTFFLGRFYEAIAKKFFFVEKTDECIFAVGAVFSFAAGIWIAIV